jgi:hypothetical protein
VQSPVNIAQLYRGLEHDNVGQNGKTQEASPLQTVGQVKSIVMECDMAGSEDEGSEQKIKLLQLMCQSQDDDLLQAMELLDGDREIADHDKNSDVLTKEVVTAIDVARELDPELKVFEKKNKKTKPNAWGSVLVDRQRRCKNDGVSMLQKAMDLKRGKTCNL